MATVTAVFTRLTVNKYASFGDLPDSTSSFQTAARPTYSTNALSQSQEKSQRGLFIMHPDDLWHHLVEAVVGLTSSFAHTSSLSQQKKRWHSLSNDAADQGSRSPQWSFGLATLKKNSISAVSNASFSLDH